MKTKVSCFLNEIKMELFAYFNNRAVVIADFATYTVLFLLFTYFGTGKSLVADYNAKASGSLLFFAGYFIWMISTRALTCISTEIISEVSYGFLFSKLTSVAPLQILYLGKFTASMIVMLVIALPLFILSVVFGGVPEISWISIPRMILCNIGNVIGMYGLGLILSSLTMVNRRLSKISVLLSTVLLFTTNTLTYHETIQNALHFFPANYCIDYTRLLIANPATYRSDVFIYYLICFALFALGSLIFDNSIKMSKKIGNVLWY